MAKTGVSTVLAVSVHETLLASVNSANVKTALAVDIQRGYGLRRRLNFFCFACFSTKLSNNDHTVSTNLSLSLNPFPRQLRFRVRGLVAAER